MGVNKKKLAVQVWERLDEHNEKLSVGEISWT